MLPAYTDPALSSEVQTLLHTSSGLPSHPGMLQPGSSAALAKQEALIPAPLPQVTWITRWALTEEAIHQVLAQPSVLAGLGLTLINVGEAGVPWKVKYKHTLEVHLCSTETKMTTAVLSFALLFFHLKMEKNSLKSSMSLQALAHKHQHGTMGANEVWNDFPVSNTGKIRTSEPFPSVQQWIKHSYFSHEIIKYYCLCLPTREFP